MKTKKFQRNIENFVCGNCGEKVVGDGYTNHCPFCLWSCHVDINPGDRAERCRGMMQPISIQTKNSKQMLVHCCQKCGFVKKNKVSKKDSFEKILEIMRRMNSNS